MQNVDGFKRSYLIGAAIIWVCIFFATAVILSGTPYFAQVLPVLSGGAVWFVVIIPAILQRVR